MSIREEIIKITDKSKKQAQIKALTDLLEKMNLQEDAYNDGQENIVEPSWQIAKFFVEDAIEEIQNGIA